MPAASIRPLPQLSTTTRVDRALAALRDNRSHLAAAVDDAGVVVGVVTLEDLVEVYIGTVRDTTHVARPTSRRQGA